jgi:hypothetical protein
MIELLCKCTGASIRTVCETMELPRSSYYHATTETPSQKADRNIGLAIQRIFASSSESVGEFGFR